MRIKGVAVAVDESEYARNQYEEPLRKKEQHCSQLS